MEYVSSSFTDEKEEKVGSKMLGNFSKMHGCYVEGSEFEPGSGPDLRTSLDQGLDEVLLLRESSLGWSRNVAEGCTHCSCGNRHLFSVSAWLYLGQAINPQTIFQVVSLDSV